MKRMMVGVFAFFIGHVVYSAEVADSFRQPLDVAGRLTQNFNVWNEDWKGYHLGEDIVVSKEEPVHAVANGEVKFVGTVSGYGYVVITEHELPDASFACFLYGHLREDDLTKKKPVVKGEIIGYLSDDAQENGGYNFVHIHQGVRKGKYVSGAPYYAANSASVWRWWWVYVGYSKNAYITQKITGSWDVTHQTMLNDWHDPTDFINSHQQATPTPFTYTPNAHSGYGPVHGGADTDWVYRLDRKADTFTEGDTVYCLLRIDDVKTDHRFKTMTYRDGAFLYDYTGNWNRVGSSVWRYAHTWARIDSATAGSWEIQFYVEADDGNGFQFVDTVRFTVSRDETLPAYTYDGNGYTGYGPVHGGADTDWVYRLDRKANTFTRGDTVYALFRIDQARFDHRFKIMTYRDGAFLYEYTGNWNRVGSSVWRYAHTWARVENASAGAWEIKLYVEADDGNGFQFVGTVQFTVLKDQNQLPFIYDSNGYTGRGPVQGGQQYDWLYWLTERTSIFNAGEKVFGMVRIDEVFADHRFKVEAYRDSVYQWQWTSDWAYVNGYWSYAHFWPTLTNASPGSWGFKILVDVYDNGDNVFQHIDTLGFSVREGTSAPPPSDNSPSITFDFDNYQTRGWTTGLDTSYTSQTQDHANLTWMVIARGPNPGVASPELPAGFSTARTPNLRFSAKLRGNVRETFGQIFIMDDTGWWGYETRFAPVLVDYKDHEYHINLSHLGNVPIRRFAIELTQNAGYEQWILDWVVLK